MYKIGILWKWAKSNAALFFVLAFGFYAFSLLHNLMHSALWFDEWVEYEYSQASVRSGELYNNIIKTFQPPLYNFIMHFWLRFRTDVEWFRLLNVVAGIVAGIFIFFTMRQLYGIWCGIAGLILLSCCNMWIYCVQEGSEYAFMLCGISIAIYSFVALDVKFRWSHFFLFLIGCIGAMYSQYGAFFLVAPMLGLFFLKILMGKTSNLFKWKIFSAYGICALLFAFPLWHFFLRIQIVTNVGGSKRIPYSIAMLRGLPFRLGQILLYLWGAKDTNRLNKPLYLAISALILSLMLCIAVMNRRIQGQMVRILIFAYLLHYVLIERHIYGMVHPNESYGYFSRYSYFYMPLLTICIGILGGETYKIIVEKENSLATACQAFILGVIVCMVGYSAPHIAGNWYKAKDNLYANIWMQNHGWETATYFYGVDHRGLDYYVTHSEGYQEGYLHNVKHLELDDDHATSYPTEYWIWSGFWGHEGFERSLQFAQDNRYQIVVYDYSGTMGGLAHCYLLAGESGHED